MRVYFKKTTWKRRWIMKKIIIFLVAIVAFSVNDANAGRNHGRFYFSIGINNGYSGYCNTPFYTRPICIPAPTNGCLGWNCLHNHQQSVVVVEKIIVEEKPKCYEKIPLYDKEGKYIKTEYRSIPCQ